MKGHYEKTVTAAEAIATLAAQLQDATEKRGGKLNTGDAVIAAAAYLANRDYYFCVDGNAIKTVRK